MEKWTKFKEFYKKHSKKFLAVTVLIFFLFICGLHLFAMPVGNYGDSVSVNNHVLTPFSVEINGDVLSSFNIVGNVTEGTDFPSFDIGEHEYSQMLPPTYNLIADGPNDVPSVNVPYYLYNSSVTDFKVIYNDFLIRRNDIRYISNVSIPLNINNPGNNIYTTGYSINAVFSVIFPYPNGTVREDFNIIYTVTDNNFNLGEAIYNDVREWYVNYGFPINYYWDDIPTCYFTNMECLYFDFMSRGKIDVSAVTNGEAKYSNFVPDMTFYPKDADANGRYYNVQGYAFQFNSTIDIPYDVWNTIHYPKFRYFLSENVSTFGNNIQFPYNSGSPTMTYNSTTVYSGSSFNNQFYDTIFFVNGNYLTLDAENAIVNIENGTWGYFEGDIAGASTIQFNMYGAPSSDYFTSAVQGYLSLYGEGDIIIRRTHIWDNVSEFFEDVVGGFLDLELFGIEGFSLGRILLFVIGFSLVMWVMKVFLGG